MANSDFASGFGMRNGHVKSTRGVDRESSPTVTPQKKRRPGAATPDAPAREPSQAAATASGSPGGVASNVSKGPAGKAKSARTARGVRVARRYTSPGIAPLDAVLYERR